MAGDWIKFELATLDKPEVCQIADAAEIDPDAAIGKLLRVWGWFDQQTEKGNAPSVSKKLLDRIVGVNGFCKIMESVGWMKDEDGVISLPHFDRHNGQTAKNRALTAKRVATHKAKSNAEGNAAIVSDALPREEKRREEIKNPLNPPERGEVTFDGTTFDVPTDVLEKWESVYKKVSVLDQIAKAGVWAAANPQKRKKNWQRFLNTWIAKANKESKELDEGSCPVDKVIDLFHKECPALPSVSVKSDPVLRRLIVERWMESEEHQSSQYWKTIFSRANRMQQIYYRGQMVVPRMELICSRSVFRQLEEQLA